MLLEKLKKIIGKSLKKLADFLHVLPENIAVIEQHTQEPVNSIA